MDGGQHYDQAWVGGPSGMTGGLGADESTINAVQPGQGGFSAGLDSPEATGHALWKETLNGQKSEPEIPTYAPLSPTAPFDEPSSMVPQAAGQQGDYSTEQYYDSGVEVPNVPYWNAVTNEPVYDPASVAEYEEIAANAHFAFDPTTGLYRNVENPSIVKTRQELESLISKYEPVDETIVDKVNRRLLARKMMTLDRAYRNQHAPVMPDPDAQVKFKQMPYLPFGLRKKYAEQQRRQCCSFA